jgi:hypothetical protein
MGFATADLDNFKILEDIPSFPVAFFIPILQSIRNYFIERCAGGPKSKHFWPTIKPFLTNKGSHFAKDIILCENDNIINNQTEVAETFNNFFINVA